MQTRTTVPSHQNNLLLWALAALGVGILSILPLSLLDGGPWTPASMPAAPAQRVAYLEFGRAADTLWLAEPADPTRRVKLYAIAHADEFGVIPSLSPDRSRFAYTVLPALTRAPSPQTPAELWLASVGAADTPRLLTQNVDLLVAPVWSPMGDFLTFRRGNDHLLTVDVASGQERELVSSDGAALFPIGFTPDAASLYYVRMTSAESTLVALNLGDGSNLPIAELSDGLTRDWKLSPAGDKLAYLAMSMDATRVASRAFVLDLASGAAIQAGPEADAFGPTWSANGELVLGSLSPSGEANGRLIRIEAGSPSNFAVTGKGFDVPLGFAPAGDQLVVRNFDGASAVNPGRERLEIVSADGSRKTITNDEVTFLGWIDP